MGFEAHSGPPAGLDPILLFSRTEQLEMDFPLGIAVRGRFCSVSAGPPD